METVLNRILNKLRSVPGARWLVACAAVLGFLGPTSVLAESHLQAAALTASQSAESAVVKWRSADTANLAAPSGLSAVSIGKSYVLGINRFDLDHETEILGWQLSNSWYFGRQDGLDSGLTLVWQAEANQVSFSKDGLRMTRRF